MADRATFPVVGGEADSARKQKARPFTPLRSSRWLSSFVRTCPTGCNFTHPPLPELSCETQKVLERLKRWRAVLRGPGSNSQLFPSQVEQALIELIGLGVVTADSFDGVRALLVPSDQRPTFGRNEGKRRHKQNLASIEFAGRWWLLPRSRSSAAEDLRSRIHAAAAEKFAWTLLRRYGVVFRRLLDREASPISWYELGKIYRSPRSTRADPRRSFRLRRQRRTIRVTR
jgi:hypothetical protein